MGAGSTITKSWWLRNCGTTTWASSYRAVQVSGSFGPASFSIPAAGAGQTVDISSSFVNHLTPGRYRATYRLQGPSGQFGDTFWLEVVVQ